MLIIPAIDIIDGKCVRLTRGDYGTKKIYDNDPVALAVEFEKKGIKYLHVVDLDGARTGDLKNFDTLRKIVEKTNLIIDAGGGIRNEKTVEKIFSAGVSSLTLGSVALNDPLFALKMLERFGPDKIILGADLKDGFPGSEGWTKQSKIDGIEFIGNFLKEGFEKVICTDIGRDGMMIGPSLDLYGRLINRFPKIKLIASGGIRGMQDLADLEKAGLFGAITGKAIYEKKLNLEVLGAL